MFQRNCDLISTIFFEENWIGVRERYESVKKITKYLSLEIKWGEFESNQFIILKNLFFSNFNCNVCFVFKKKESKKESEVKKEEERLSYLFEKEDLFWKDVLNWKEGKETQLSSFFKEVKKEKLN